MNIRKHHGAGGHGGFLILSALVTLALILRSPLTAIAPIVNDLRQGLSIGAVTIGLLTSIPIFCFGMLTPLASWFIGRAGIEASIFVTLAGAALGMIVRSSGGSGLALFGTLILGAALTIGNIVCLMVIARDFPQRTRMITGIYTSALNVGTMMTSAVTAPLAGLVGWRLALAAVTVLVIPGIALWIAASSRGAASAPRQCAKSGPPDLRLEKPQANEVPLPVHRRPIAWLLVIAFSTHLFIYYGITAWLPAYLIQADSLNASEAGLVASLFQILALLGSFGAPALAGRVSLPRLLVVMAVCWIITPLGLLMAPHEWIVWSITGGIATGGGFTVVFMLIMTHAHDLQDNRRISAFVQGIGYSLSSVGPLVIGSLNQTFGGWTAGFLLLSATAVAMLGSGLCVTRIKTNRIAA